MIVKAQLQCHIGWGQALIETKQLTPLHPPANQLPRSHTVRLPPRHAFKTSHICNPNQKTKNKKKGSKSSNVRVVFIASWGGGFCDWLGEARYWDVCAWAGGSASFFVGAPSGAMSASRANAHWCCQGWFRYGLGPCATMWNGAGTVRAQRSPQAIKDQNKNLRTERPVNTSSACICMIKNDR